MKRLIIILTVVKEANTISSPKSGKVWNSFTVKSSAVCCDWRLLACGNSRRPNENGGIFPGGLRGYIWLNKERSSYKINPDCTNCCRRWKLYFTRAVSKVLSQKLCFHIFSGHCFICVFSLLVGLLQTFGERAIAKIARVRTLT